MWWGLRSFFRNYWELLLVIFLTHTHMDGRTSLQSHTHHARTQVVIFVKSVQRCIALAQLLVEQNFPAIAIHRGMPQEERWVRDGQDVLCPCEQKGPLREENLNTLSDFLSHKGFLGISSLKIFNDGFSWLPTCLAEAWTSSGWTLPLTTTCLRIQIPTCIG